MTWARSYDFAPDPPFARSITAHIRPNIKEIAEGCQAHVSHTHNDLKRQAINILSYLIL